MLKLKQITKDYITGNETVHALRGVSIEFRKSEFVSILGPSGCGKTTLLNIIGGLDRYTDGDLIINGKSTKTFKDSDWDSYRNHSIGFVFQSYNLIPHQSVLSNVELALTLSGVSKTERRKRAIAALESVGLGDQIHKKPSQMSGGQMQRVAIARALVNDPDILLADEPTGALDTTTSVQIMEILKKISRDRLIIMVTHNPELAETYSTRIIKVIDGQVTSDSDPYTTSEDVVEESASKLTAKEIASAKKAKKKEAKKQKTSMSFFTALSLSFNNLRTKKGRTVMTSFAGSIGIIGIALILAISNGINTYIEAVQRDSLSSYPITITREDTDISSLLSSMSGNDGNEKPTHENDAVYVNGVFYDLIKNLTSTSKRENNLEKFKNDFLDKSDVNGLDKHVLAIQYTYDVPMNIFVKGDDGYSRTDMSSIFGALTGSNGSSGTIMNMSSSFSSYSMWGEMMPPLNKVDTNGNDIYINNIIHDQYDLIYGEWPDSYDEVLLVVDKNNEINDMTYFALGYISQEQMQKTLLDAMRGTVSENPEYNDKLSYEEVCGITFKILPNYALYNKTNTGEWVNIQDNESLLRGKLENDGIDVKITGVIRPNEDALANSISGSIAYTYALTEEIINRTNDSEIAKAQLADIMHSVFDGKSFTDDGVELSNADKISLLREFAGTKSHKEKADLYIKIVTSIPQETINAELEAYKKNFLGVDVLPNINDMSDDDYDKYIDKLISLMISQGGEDYQDMDPEMLKGIMKSMDRVELEELIDQTLIDNYIMPTLGAAGESDIYAKASLPSNDKLSELIAIEHNKVITNEQMLALATQMKQLAAFNPQYAQFANMTDEQIVKLFTIANEYQNDAVDAMTVILTIAQKTPDEQERLYQAILTERALSAYVPSEEEINANISAMLDDYLANQDEDKLVEAYDHLPSGLSETTYEDNLELLGICDLDNPSSVNIYTPSFEDKDMISDMINKYNEGLDKDDQIVYTDIVKILMSSITTIINAISYVLIAFVSISLIVSSIMIGIITNISVLERTKEIGILRAIGASKKDVSRVFNAETLIVGLAAGAIGILTTVLLCFPITYIIQTLSQIDNIRAELPIWGGIILVIISMALTLVAGIIPSRSAAKKDPVIALRTE